MRNCLRILCLYLQPNLTFSRARHFVSNMSALLQPPPHVRGMTQLDREAFTKSVKVPTLRLGADVNFNLVFPSLKKLLLKMDHLKPVIHETDSTAKKILLHPSVVKGWDDLPNAELEEHGLSSSKNFIWDEITLRYENWKPDVIFKAILPADQENSSSFSRVGHVLHLNLRDHLSDYKTLIGQVLKDKVVGCRTVVNKTQTIDNTYRNFQMELLCGEADYQVTVKENGVTYEFDFSSVYWNPRLSMEHERIVKMLQTGDYLFDCFAGVGPFSVPAAKKKCKVWANDLNPESYKWLQHNAKKNKVLANLQTFNKDGRAFILTDLKTQLMQLLKNPETDSKAIHITMNLPAMATEFLDAFVGLFSGEDVKLGKCRPLVHVYCFAKGEAHHKEIAKQLAETHMGIEFTDNLKEITLVRNVAPNKEMVRISFYLNDDILFGKSVKRAADGNDDEIAAKRQCNDFFY